MTRTLFAVITGVILFSMITPVTAGPIIINHSCTDISKIPDPWIAAVKSRTQGVDMAYTSFGIYIIDGLIAWQGYNSKYAFANIADGSNGCPAGNLLKIGGRNGYDGWPDYVSDTSPLDSGKFKYSMCTPRPSEALETVAQTDAYLAQMESFEAAYPNITFIYATGFADAGASDGGAAYRSNNARIREYCIAHNKILYDYEDIGSHSPDGTNYLNDGCGIRYVYSYPDECTYNGGNWCSIWMNQNPGSIFTAVSGILVEINPYGCYHSAKPAGALQGTLKGAAFWWMMARLEGWEGTFVPVASFTANITSGQSPLNVLFTDSSTGTTITNRRWDFGDGNISNYAVRTDPLHIYSNPGTYSVNLTVTNVSGSNSQLRNNYISVSAPPAAPVASFTGTPLTGTAPLDVVFTDSSTGSSITHRRWDFGDGNISTYTVSINPSHRYISAGTYTVNLTVIGTGGSDSEEKSGFIDVTNIPETNKTTQIGIIRNPTGNWYLDTTGTGVVNKTFQFGKSGDIPVVGDWNGDGADDTGVFRPSIGYWYLDYNNNGFNDKSIKFGKSDDIPVVGDWNGDGISDIGVFRPATGTWYLDTTKTGVVNMSFQFGKSGDIPVVGKWT